MGGDSSRLLRNASWLAGANLMAKGIWFVFIGPLCAALLGLYGYGVFMAAISVGLLVSSLTDGGLSLLGVREVSTQPQDEPAIYATLVAMRLGLAALSLVVIVVVGWGLRYSTELLYAAFWGTLYAGMLSLRALLRGFLDARGLMHIEGALVMAERLCVVAAGLAAAWLTRNPVSTLAAMALALTVVALLHVAGYARWAGGISVEHGSLKRASGLFRAGLGLWIAGLFGTLYYRSDVVILERIGGEGVTGLYGLAYQVLTGANLLATVVAESLLFPQLVRAWANRDAESHRRLMRQGFVLLLPASLLAALAVQYVPEEWLRSLPRLTDFSAALPLAKALIWVFPINCVHAIATVAVLASHRQQALTGVLLIGSALSIGGNLLLLPRYGVYAAVLMTFVCEVVVTAGCLAVVHRAWRPLTPALA